MTSNDKCVDAMEQSIEVKEETSNEVINLN